MPRYFFDIHDGEVSRDEAGMVLFSEEAARREAYSIVSRYASNPINLIMDGLVVVTVRDGPHSEVLTLRLVCQEDGLDNRARSTTTPDSTLARDRKNGANSQHS
ncbi:DUF6894 family protein [Methylobacterium brachythecii]|uniref:DUF6894 domain-containing protein n=1 Tax=Methylobacterium brachythecii TaxID=1176177 RepID=A0A7W6AN97_9HYPH|nr:hypothetical protein [Methylobacterium brachythecii]MBB3902762.1 hypothetical protein [Methylobacterium brachythecii]GLS42606.1 hypothetical protein GCM10007884_05910 [Methylobacterium brachythecii]